jgi:hypothetical protein
MSDRGCLFVFIGFIAGGALGVGVCHLVFSFEHGGAGGGGDWYKVHICGMEISPVHGIFAGLILQAVPSLFFLVLGIAGGIGEVRT